MNMLWVKNLSRTRITPDGLPTITSEQHNAIQNCITSQDCIADTQKMLPVVGSCLGSDQKIIEQPSLFFVAWRNPACNRLNEWMKRARGITWGVKFIHCRISHGLYPIFLHEWV